MIGSRFKKARELLKYSKGKRGGYIPPQERIKNQKLRLQNKMDKKKLLELERNQLILQKGLIEAGTLRLSETKRARKVKSEVKDYLKKQRKLLEQMGKSTKPIDNAMKNIDKIVYNMMHSKKAEEDIQRQRQKFQSAFDESFYDSNGSSSIKRETVIATSSLAMGLGAIGGPVGKIIGVSGASLAALNSLSPLEFAIGNLMEEQEKSKELKKRFDLRIKEIEKQLKEKDEKRKRIKKSSS